MLTNALITGASSGIGLAVAHRCHHHDLTVSGVARQFYEPDVPWLRKFCIDLANLSSLPDQMVALPEDIDLLVLNAGYGQFGGLEQFSYTQIQQLIDTNLVSNLFLLKRYLPGMKQRGGGDIVIVGSESGLQGARSGAVYCASKFALRGLAQSLRADCATSNIRVILVNPGPVATDFFADLSFEPKVGDNFVLQPEQVADSVWHALQQPRNVVVEELNLQPMSRSFQKK